MNLPGDEVQSSGLAAGEQEVLFVQIDEVKTTVKNGKVLAKVHGTGSISAPIDQLPFGYFSKRIAQAGHDRTKDFYFFQVDVNKGRFQDVIERTFSFIFFYSSQYDPDNGNITSIDFEATED